MPDRDVVADPRMSDIPVSAPIPTTLVPAMSPPVTTTINHNHLLSCSKRVTVMDNHFLLTRTKRAPCHFGAYIHMTRTSAAMVFNTPPIKKAPVIDDTLTKSVIKLSCSK
jgi:hypothetical protein